MLRAPGHTPQQGLRPGRGITDQDIFLLVIGFVCLFVKQLAYQVLHVELCWLLLLLPSFLRTLNHKGIVEQGPAARSEEKGKHASCP